MKRLKKALLIPARILAYRLNYLRLYYWSERQLYALGAVNVLPELYYRCLFNLSMRLVKFNKFRRLADRLIHTIPYHIRFDVA